MTTFDKRERAFEQKFAQDEELKFKAHARRNRLVGLWAARKLGLVGIDAETYAKTLVTADLDKPDSDGVFEKVNADLENKGITPPSHEIRQMMDELMTQALADVKAGH